MADFPYGQSDSIQYNGPALFVRGTKSQYVSDDTLPAIKKFFPSAQVADVEAGHWLISENPEEFRQGKLMIFELPDKLSANVKVFFNSGGEISGITLIESESTIKYTGIRIYYYKTNRRIER
jgi:hypothetical protein